MNTIPDYMPVLSGGGHSDPKQGACVMEYVSLLAGEPWSDHPSCTHRVLASMARAVNDRLSDSERQQLVPLIPRLFGTSPTGTDLEQRVLSVRLAVWCAKQVLQYGGAESVALAAIRAAELWANDPTPEHAQSARAAAYATTAAYAATAAAYATAASAAAAYAATAATYAADAAYATAASAAAAYAAYATTTTTAAADAAYAAATAAATTAAAAAAATTAAAAAADAAYATVHRARGQSLIALLTGLVDEYDRLAGREQFAPVDFAALACDYKELVTK